jgi:hypothetical protein
MEDVRTRSRELVVTFLGGSLQGRVFKYGHAATVLIGRARGCTIEVVDPKVSRRHCVIQFDGWRASVKDLGSANGTFLNGVEIGLALLEPGDLVRLAGTHLRVDVHDSDRGVRGGAPHVMETLCHGVAPPPPTESQRTLRNRALRVAIPGLELGEVLGEGATSAVFEARRACGEAVAVKVLRVAQSVAADERLRFLREAETASSLVHPNIVRVLGQGESGGLLYIVMELVRGETLGERLKHEGPLPLELALDVVRQIADALELARTKDVVHRDVKPDNIILSDDGVAKLLDFGLAKSILGAGKSGLTLAGDVLGTLAYMAPEQLDSAVHADHRADIYSLGATAYHLISGRTPFAARTNMDYFAKILHEEPPELDSLRSDVWPAVSSFVARCMKKRPGERFSSAAAVARLVTELLEGSRDSLDPVAVEA